MMEVDLFTRDGEYVATALIAPFQVMPEILLWGTRTFVRDPSNGEYREGMMVWVIEHKIKPAVH